MAIILQENWSSYAENTEVQNISGWTTNGAFASNLAGAKVNATSQIKSTTSDGTLAYYESGTSSHYSEAVVSVAPSAGVESIGPAVRCNDWKNFIGMRPYGTSNVQVYHRTGSTSYQQLALPSYTHVAGDVYKLEVDGDTLRAYVNSVQVGSDIDITGIQSGSKAGFWVAGSRDPAIGNIEIGTLVSDTLTIDPSPDRKVFPVFGATRNHTISGTYSGVTTPTSIEYRIEEYVGGATVTDWTTLDASPSAGIYSGVVAVPKGVYYKIRTRFSNSITVTAETLRIGFGIGFEAGGQSNMEALFGTGGTATASDNTCIFNGSTWVLPTNQHIAHLLNSVAAANNCVVAIYDTSVSSSAISQHLSGGSNYAARVADLTAFGGELNGFLWGQGESDAGGSYATYQTKLGELYTDILTRTGQSSATLPMFIVQLGRNEGASGNDVGWQTVREAQTNYASATANAYISHQTMDLPMADGLHRNASGYQMEALRAGDTINSVLTGGGNDGLGVKPASASLSGSDVIITHDLNGSASISLPANAKDVYEVSEDDFSTLLTINSIATASNDITLTLSAPPAGSVKVRSLQGQDPDETKMPTGTVLYNGQAVMVAPVVTELIAPTISSTLNITLVGGVDGVYPVKLYDGNTLVFDANATVASSSVSFILSAPVSTRIQGYITDGNNPSTNAAYIEGVTV